MVPLDRDGPDLLRTQLEDRLRERSGPAGSSRGAAAVHPRAGPGPRHLARDGRRVLRPAAGRGLPGRPGRVGDPGRRDRAGPTGTSAPPVRRVGPAGGRLPPGRARPGLVPAGRLGQGGGRGVPVGGERRVRLRRPARRRGAAHGAGQLPGPGPGRGRRPGPDGRVHRLLPGPQPRAADPGRAGVDRVAFEDPGYDETGRIAAGLAGLAVVRVPVDEQGLRVDELAATGAGAVVVTPAHQWPTGVVLSPARRRALADWARRTGGWCGGGRLRRRVPVRPGARRRRAGARARTGWSRSAR